MVDLALRAPILCTMVSTLGHFEVHEQCVWSTLKGSCSKESVLKMSCDLLNSRKPAGDVEMVGVKEDQLAIYNGRIMNSPSLVRIHNCFIRNEGWERRGLSYDQPSIWCVVLMKFKKSYLFPWTTAPAVTPIGNIFWEMEAPHPRNHYISHVRAFIRNRWGWSMSEIL